MLCSWPILLTVIAVSFGLGAFWQSKRAEDQRIQFEHRPVVNRGERVGLRQFGDSRGPTRAQGRG